MTASGSTADLLAALPQQPAVKKPFLRADFWATEPDRSPERVAEVRAMLSDSYLDDLLADLFRDLPGRRDQVRSAAGPSGVRLVSRPSNSINTLTLPTADGAVIVYNLGFHGLMYSVARAVVGEVQLADRATEGGGAGTRPADATVEWLASVVDWSTSLAHEPRFEGAPPDGDRGFATHIAGMAQRFALCHELGHVLALDRAADDTVTTVVDGVVVDAVALSHQREFDADAAGTDLLVEHLRAQGQHPVGALVGAELFLCAMGLLQPFATSAEQSTHPDPDERLARVHAEYAAVEGGDGDEWRGAWVAVGSLLRGLRPVVAAAVQRRRAAVRAQLEADSAAAAAAWDDADDESRRAAARSLSRHVTASPGATLAWIAEVLSAPVTAADGTTGSPLRLLALNAALGLEAPLRVAINDAGVSSVLRLPID